MSRGELILHRGDNGMTRVHLRTVEGTVWFSKAEMAKLFNVKPSTISVFNSKESLKTASYRDMRGVKELVSSTEDAEHHGCDERRPTFMYNLKAILAIGMRVETPCASQLRRHFNSLIKEYVVKGFIMDDNRLSQTERWDYFDEWLARIRAMRTSEKRFYQKVKDLYATAVDYDETSNRARQFHTGIQSMMFWVATGRTTATMIAERGMPKNAEVDHRLFPCGRIGNRGSRHRSMAIDGLGDRRVQPNCHHVS